MYTALSEEELEILSFLMLVIEAVETDVIDDGKIKIKMKQQIMVC